MEIRRSQGARWQAATTRIIARLKRTSGADLLIALGILGLGARFLIAFYSTGTNDILYWEEFSGKIRRGGVGPLYVAHYLFNHPPLIGVVASWLHALSDRTGVRFALVFKTLPILADAMSAWLVQRAWRRKGSKYAALAFAAFCWNPVSVLISGYHGNTDAICAGLVLLAAVLIDDESPALGGLALGASINVKLIPVLLIPALLSCTRTRRQALRFGLGLALAALPFLPTVLFYWHPFYTGVLRYRSSPGEWGLTEIVRQIAFNPRFKPLGDAFLQFWIEHGTIILFLFAIGVAVINLRTRRFRATTIAAIVFAGFLVLTPGWAVQYAVYLVPVLFATHIGYAVAYAVVTGAYLFFVYAALWTGARPFYSDFWAFFDGGPIGAPLLAAVAWTLCIFTLVRLLRIRDATDPRFPPPSTHPSTERPARPG